MYSKNLKNKKNMEKKSWGPLKISQVKEKTSYKTK